MSRAYWGRYNAQTHSREIKEAYNRLFSEPPSIIALDTETVSLKNKTVLGVGFGTPAGDNFYFDITDPTLPWHLLANNPTRKIWHNATFDLSWEVMGKFGIDIDNIEDTAILTRLQNIETELKYAAFWSGGETWSVKELLDDYKAKTMADLPWEVVAEKCCRDVDVTMRLYLKYRNQVNQEYYEVQREMVSLLLHMSHRGILLDKPLVSAIDKELEAKSDLFTNTCKSLGFNPHAPEQVAYTMTDLGYYLPFPKGAKQPTVDKDVLSEIDHPWATLTLLARKYSRLYGVIHPWVGLDRVHSHFHLTASTGRITSEDEQLHNIPTGERPGDIVPDVGPIRRTLLPDADEFTRFDLSQIELRALQWFTGDPRMADAFEHEAVIDGKIQRGIHIYTMQRLRLPTKVMAKNFNFGSLYGGDVAVLSKFTGIKDLNYLSREQQNLRKLFPITWDWIDKQREQGLRDLEVETLYGRKLSLLPRSIGEVDKGGMEKHIMNCAVNYKIQGTAYEIFARTLISLKQNGIPVKDFILQVHDEQLLDGRHDIPKGLEDITGRFKTPLDVSYIRRWQ